MKWYTKNEITEKSSIKYGIVSKDLRALNNMKKS